MRHQVVGFRSSWLLLFAVVVLCRIQVSRAEDAPKRVPEAVYRGDLVAYPGPWGFMPRGHIILVSDQELETLAEDPDRKLNLATTFQPREESLREVCERAQQRDQRTLVLAFDHFFRQYRPGQDVPRRLTPAPEGARSFSALFVVLRRGSDRSIRHFAACL